MPSFHSSPLSCLALLCCVFIMARLQPAGAQDADVGGGIVLTRTVTVGGQEFAQSFLAAWRELPASEQYSLTVLERPSARWGSEVWIEYAQRRVFQARLPASRATMRRAGEQAAGFTLDAIQAADRQRKLLKDADLAPDEF